MDRIDRKEIIEFAVRTIKELENEIDEKRVIFLRDLTINSASFDAYSAQCEIDKLSKRKIELEEALNALGPRVVARAHRVKKFNV